MGDNEGHLFFRSMDEAWLRRWVEANPGRINDWDSMRQTALCRAAAGIGSVALVLWLVNKKGADVNATDNDGNTPLFLAYSSDIVDALLDCGGDPILQNKDSLNALMYHLYCQHYGLVARLLQDARIQASVNAQNCAGNRALHYACGQIDQSGVPAIVQLLLENGTDTTFKNTKGETPIDWLRRHHPTHSTTLALVERSLDTEKASFLVKARRLVMAATRTTPPSYLQNRMACGLSLPTVALAPVTEAQDEEEAEDEEKARRELRTMLAWLVGLEGGHMPRDVFRVVLDLLIPWWDPLRRKVSKNKEGKGEGKGEEEERIKKEKEKEKEKGKEKKEKVGRAEDVGETEDKKQTKTRTRTRAQSWWRDKAGLICSLLQPRGRRVRANSG